MNDALPSATAPAGSLPEARGRDDGRPRSPAAAAALGRALARWCDPEWLPFAGVMLLPALGCLALGDGRRAPFFLGLAAYAAALKWLGWLLLTRLVPPPPRAWLRFPAELFGGLAVL